MEIRRSSLGVSSVSSEFPAGKWCALSPSPILIDWGDREKLSKNRENKSPPDLTSDLSVEYVAPVRQEVTPARPRKAERLLGMRERERISVWSFSRRGPREGTSSSRNSLGVFSFRHG